MLRDTNKNTPAENLDLLTIIICQILGKPNDDFVLTTLNRYIYNVLLQETNPQDEFTLYYTLEPQIIAYLKSDETARELAEYVYAKVLTKICELVNQKDYKTAKKNYGKLMRWLIAYCDLTDEYIRLRVKTLKTPLKRFTRGRVFKIPKQGGKL